MNGLIDCNACHTEIANSADNCPKCGAKNDYRHPEIIRFLENVENIELPEKCEYAVTDRTSLAVQYISKSIMKPHYHFIKAFFLIFVSAGLSSFFLESMILWTFMYYILPTFFLIYSIMGFIQYWFKINEQTMINLGAEFYCGHIQSGNSPSYGNKIIYFDFSENPVKIESNDNEFWSELLKFFNHEDAMGEISQPTLYRRHERKLMKVVFLALIFVPGFLVGLGYISPNWVFGSIFFAYYWSIYVFGDQTGVSDFREQSTDEFIKSDSSITLKLMYYIVGIAVVYGLGHLISSLL